MPPVKIKPPLIPALLIPLSLSFLGFALVTFMVVYLLSLAIDIVFFLSVLGASVVITATLAAIYWLARLVTLCYEVDDQYLHIRCLGTRLSIPVRHIQKVHAGDGFTNTPSLSGLRRLFRPPGVVSSSQLGEVHSYTISHRSEHLALVKTPARVYALSLRNPGHLAALCYDARRSLVSQSSREELVESNLVEFMPIWDRASHRVTIFLAIAFNLVLFAYLSSRYQQIAPFVPLHYNPLGEVDRIGTQADLFRVPALGTVVILLNLLLASFLHRRDTFASMLLLLAAATLQGILFVAVVNLAS